MLKTVIAVALLASVSCATPPAGSEVLPIQSWHATWLAFDTLSVQLANAKLRGDIGDADYAKIIKASVAFRQSMADWRLAMNDTGRYIDGRGPGIADVAMAALRAVGAIWTPPSPVTRPTARMGGGGGSLASLVLCLAVNAATGRRANGAGARAWTVASHA